MCRTCITMPSWIWNKTGGKALPTRRGSRVAATSLMEQASASLLQDVLHGAGSDLQSAEEVWEFVHKQDHAVQQNGIWIVVTHPEAYSASEHALLEAVKAMCRQKKIPLFIARAAQLPHGWQRYDNLPSTHFNF